MIEINKKEEIFEDDKKCIEKTFSDVFCNFIFKIKNTSSFIPDSLDAWRKSI